VGDPDKKIVFCFELISPYSSRQKFQAAIISGGGVVSNRSGSWKSDEALTYADLIMPEQGPLYEWDVTRIEPDQLEGFGA
jgi:hypothetical protein